MAALLTITRSQFRRAYKKFANVFPNGNSEDFLTLVLAELGIEIIKETRK